LTNGELPKDTSLRDELSPKVAKATSFAVSPIFPKQTLAKRQWHPSVTVFSLGGTGVSPVLIEGEGVALQSGVPASSFGER
jgi:hypothetical protein